MKYLAHGSSLRTQAWDFCIERSTIYKIIPEFPHLLGAVDGTYIWIKAPVNSKFLYFNYKKYFSIVRLAACDCKYRFTWVHLVMEVYGIPNSDLPKQKKKDWFRDWFGRRL
ncbi:Nuclease harbi1-like protein [Temnothorax longispinosus]|uniref:Nuclease harbi1-like protein n=1 Tax=Temnothorax longispinosus TaxID=300112 RepID=A0A4S2KH11_9HYME|nr:Nuclease harbi1-like protein [Temnothorax longispinosus]